MEKQNTVCYQGWWWINLTKLLALSFIYFSHYFLSSSLLLSVISLFIFLSTFLPDIPHPPLPQLPFDLSSHHLISLFCEIPVLSLTTHPTFCYECKLYKRTVLFLVLLCLTHFHAFPLTDSTFLSLVFKALHKSMSFICLSVWTTCFIWNLCSRFFKMSHKDMYFRK